MSCVAVWPFRAPAVRVQLWPAASGNRTRISQTQTGRADHYATHTYVTPIELFSIILPNLEFSKYIATIFATFSKFGFEFFSQIARKIHPKIC